MPSLEQVLGPVRALPAGDRAFGARMLLRLERLLASAAAALHPAVRPRGAAETLADQDRILATWLAAYYAGVSATPEVLRGDLLEPLIARSGCAEPFCGPAEGGDDGSSLRFGLPSKPEARCDTRSELLRAAAAAIIALHAYLNYSRTASMPADETSVSLSTLVIRSLAPPPSSSSSGAASTSSAGTAAEEEDARRQQEHADAMAKLDDELAELGLLPSSRALLAAAGLRLKAPAAGEGGAKTAGEAAAAADAAAEAEEAADAAAADAADAAREGDASGASQANDILPASLPGVPSLASGASAASRTQLEALPPLRTSHVRWLMHWCRGRVLATMADVSLAVQEQEEQQEGGSSSSSGDGTRRATMLLAAAQRDALGMASALPAHPTAYSLFAALAMRGQQFQAAVPFLRRGLAVARACRDDATAARMCSQLAAALLLGGGGKSQADPSKPQPVALQDVLALLDAGDGAAEKCAAWWPAGGAFGPCPGDGEPERSVVWAKLLPALAAREGLAVAAAFDGGGDDDAEAETAASALAKFLAETEDVAPLEGLAWVSPPPSAVPPGAVLVEGEEEQEEEEDDEGEEAAAAAAAAAVMADPEPPKEKKKPAKKK
jgi:hypothetical protein